MVILLSIILIFLLLIVYYQIKITRRCIQLNKQLQLIITELQNQLVKQEQDKPKIMEALRGIKAKPKVKEETR